MDLHSVRCFESYDLMPAWCGVGFRACRSNTIRTNGLQTLIPNPSLMSSAAQ